MVAAGRQEGGAGTVPLRHFEPEDVTVEPDRPFEVCDLQMNVPDPDAGMDR
jgi:hypothetical protein